MAHQVQTVVTALDNIRQKYPDREAIVTRDEDMTRGSITFQELWTLASRFAYILRQEGVKRGDFVVVSTPLSVENFVANFGVMLAGGVQLTMEKFFTGMNMITQTITMSKARFLVLCNDTGNPVWEIFKDDVKVHANNKYLASIARDDMPTLKTIFFTNRETDQQRVSFLDRLRKATESYTDTGLRPTDGATTGISLNAGAVGKPKLCEMSHGALIATGHALTKTIPNIPKTFMPLPWYITAYLPFDTLMGHTRVAVDWWKGIPNNFPDLCVRVIGAEDVQSAIIDPAKMIHVTNKKGKCVDIAVTGGQPLTRGIFDSIRNYSSRLFYMYFCTEAMFVSAKEIGTGDFTALDNGELLEGVEMRILNSNLEDVPAGESGRIAIRSPTLFTRYVGEPERTKAAWLKNGWFLTEDAGSIRFDGHVIVYGRSGDVISRGIVITHPGWLEKPISGHPDIMEVTVVPVPDEINMQNTCACVVKKPGSTLTEKDVLDLVSKSMTKDGNIYFVLDYAVFFDDALPKLTRTKLGELAAQKLGLTK